MSTPHGESMGGGGSGGSGGSGAGVHVASAAQPVAFEAVLVKVGDGRWRTVDFDVMPLNGGTLLKALKQDEIFKDSFGVARLDKCDVTVFASASKKGPSASEEGGAEELTGAETLGSLTRDMVTAMRPYLYIRVALPSGGEYPRTS